MKRLHRVEVLNHARETVCIREVPVDPNWNSRRVRDHADLLTALAQAQYANEYSLISVKLLELES